MLLCLGVWLSCVALFACCWAHIDLEKYLPPDVWVALCYLVACGVRVVNGRYCPFLRPCKSGNRWKELRSGRLKPITGSSPRVPLSVENSYISCLSGDPNVNQRKAYLISTGNRITGTRSPVAPATGVALVVYNRKRAFQRAGAYRHTLLLRCGRVC